MKLESLINENVKLINTRNGKTIAFGTVELIEDLDNKKVIKLKNNTKKIIFKNIEIQYIIL
jgi:hypothetical protein